MNALPQPHEDVEARLRQGIVSADRGRCCSLQCFPAARGGTPSAENTTHTHARTHGYETKGKETLIKYYASSAS